VVRKAIGHVVARKVGGELDKQLPAGSAGVVVVYDHEDADTVDKALANAIPKSTSKMDKAGARELREGLAEAGAGLSG
jgi:hypothetical protein